MKQPHSLHWWVNFKRLGHDSQIEYRLFASFSVERSLFGFIKSHGRE
jgi:hypothetical protein